MGERSAADINANDAAARIKERLRGRRQADPRRLMTKKQPKRISPWEWLAAAVATAIVAAMIVTLVVAGGREQTPPRFAITVHSIAPSGTDFLVHFSIRNEGSQTGSQIVVEAELRGDSGEPETSSVTFDYVPGRSERRGGVLFRRDPRAGQLTLRPLGYREP